MTAMSKNITTRYCKDCERELMSSNKNKRCENCRRLRADKRKKALGIGSSAALGIIALAKTGIISNVIKKK